MVLRRAAVVRVLTLAAFVLASALGADRVGASATVTDQSDLWYNPAEAGWGMQLSHRGNVIFVTVYAYDAAGKPTWFVAQLAPGANGWTGDVYVTTGPWFGAPTFDPATVVARKAGTMTWKPGATATDASVTYTVDGVAVTKSVVREHLDDENYAGKYRGLLSWVNSCSGVHENIVDVLVTQGGTNVSVNWSNLDTRDTCSFVGTLTQDGGIGTVAGQFECTPVHDDGTFKFTELRVTPYALSGRYTSRDADTGCSSEGYLGVGRLR